MKWYPKNTGNIHDQALVIDEETGENIAVSYKSEHAPILAAAPEMLELLREAYYSLDKDKQVRGKIERFLYGVNSELNL